MPLNISYLELRYSGGKDNTSQENSLGGPISDTPIRSKTISQYQPLKGVIPFDAPGSLDGDGEISYDAGNRTLSWKPFGISEHGEVISITESGKYAIPAKDNNGFIYIEVNIDELPETPANGIFVVQQIKNNLFGDISKTDSYYGSTKYRCFYAINTHPTDSFIGSKCFIGSQPTGTDTIDIGLDPAFPISTQIPGFAQRIEHEKSTPKMVAFLRPSNFENGLDLGMLTPNKYSAIWQRQKVPAQTETAFKSDDSIITFSVGY